MLKRHEYIRALYKGNQLFGQKLYKNTQNKDRVADLIDVDSLGIYKKCSEHICNWKSLKLVVFIRIHPIINTLAGNWGTILNILVACINRTEKSVVFFTKIPNWMTCEILCCPLTAMIVSIFPVLTILLHYPFNGNFESESLDFLDLTSFFLTSTDSHLAYVFGWNAYKCYKWCIFHPNFIHLVWRISFGVVTFFKSVQIIIRSKFGSYLDTYSLIFVGGLWYLIK